MTISFKVHVCTNVVQKFGQANQVIKVTSCPVADCNTFKYFISYQVHQRTTESTSYKRILFDTVLLS